MDSDHLKVRRTNTSLKNISPGTPKKHYSRSISVQDIMGGEKRATEILSPTRRTSLVSPSSSHGSPSFRNAEERVHGILEARELRQRRRSDICKSLDIASPVVDKNSRKSINGIQNITLPLNDMADCPNGAERVGRRRRRSSIGGGSGKRSDVSHEHRTRMMKALEAPNSSGKKNNANSLLNPFTPKSSGMKRSGSASALANKLRQKLQGANYCDLNDSGHSKFEVDLKPSVYSCDTDDCTLSESDDYMDLPKKESKTRSKSRQRSRSKGARKMSRRDSDEGEESEKKGRSKSKSRLRSKSKSKLKQQRRSSKVEGPATEDETSVTSDNLSTSFSRRSKRRPKNLVDEASYASEPSEIDASARSAMSIESAKSRNRVSQNALDISNSSTESFSSPGSFRGKKKSKNKKSSSGEDNQSLSGFLLESGRKNRSMNNDDLSHVTEEKTIASADPSQFLQFDPTSSQHVRSIDQNKAKITSASINGLHGMTPKLKIAELSGLPTFEKQDSRGESTSTATTVESLGSHAHSSNNLFATIPMTPKKGTYRRSASMVSATSPGIYRRSASMVSATSPLQMPADNFSEMSSSKNAQWNFGANSAQNSRSASAGMKLLLNNKKGAEKPMRRSSMDSGFTNGFTKATRRNSMGSMVGLRGRYNSRGFGDSELLLSS